MLKRAILTYHTIADELNCHWITHYKDYRLNEKHYGALQGLEKESPCATISKEDLNEWRESYSDCPPGLALDDYRHPCHDRKYKHVPPEYLPAVESLKDTKERIVPFWEN